jgi:hypothetical protein
MALGALLSLSKIILFMIALCGRLLHCACQTKYEGVEVQFSSKFGKNQCLYVLKQMIPQKKVLIISCLGPDGQGCGIYMGLPRPPVVKKKLLLNDGA